LSKAELDTCLAAGLSRPQRPQPPAGALVRRAAYSAQYWTLFGYLGLPRALAVYEPGAGASDSVAVAVDAYSDGRGRYATVNLNRPLRDQFRAKTARTWRFASRSSTVMSTSASPQRTRRAQGTTERKVERFLILFFVFFVFLSVRIF